MRIHLALLLLTSLNGVIGAELPRSTPEAQGVPSSAIEAFIDGADRTIDSLNSFMLVRHGQVIAEGWWAPYNAQSAHSMYSLSKSFTSTAVGLAIAEGRFSLDDEVLKFFPEKSPANPSANLKAMRVRDLLRMNTGHETEPARPPAQSWRTLFLNQPVKFKPGTHFLYNTSATYMLSAIVEKTTGLSLLDYLFPRLFDPLGIENPTWEKSPEGICYGGSGLSIRTEDIARFGQLYLQKGKWRGYQLVPESWVTEATSLQTSNGSNPKSDWDQGYGYQFWRCQHNCYRGDGAFGQYCLVMPQQDAVIAITSGLKDMQAVLNLVWEKLLPAMNSEPLPADDTARQALTGRLQRLSLRTQGGAASAPTALTALAGKEFSFRSNAKKLERLRLIARDDGSASLVGQFDGATQRIECRPNAWTKGNAGWATQPAQPMAASGAWTSDDTFTAKICFYQTPFVHTVRLKCTREELHYTAEQNVGFSGTKDAELIGTVVPAEESFGVRPGG